MAPGWRKEIEHIWKKGTTRLRYIYNWFIDENNVPKVSFYSEKIHCRNNFRWVNPVHEILKYEGNEKQIYTDNIVINHYPDRTKSRSSYLPLLELSVKENPSNDRNMHYLGREYMYYGRWNEAIDTLIKHLKLESATWKDERCASMRFISRCYKNLNRFDEAEMWLKKAINEAPYLREPYTEMAILKYGMEDYSEVITYAEKALTIKVNEKTYINEVWSWDETLNDLLSIAYFNIHNIDEAIKNAQTALKINPNNERIKENLKIFESVKQNEK